MNRLGPWMCAVWLAAGCSGNDEAPVYTDDLIGEFVVDAADCMPLSTDSLRVRIWADPMSAHGINLLFSGGNWLPEAGAVSYGLAGYDNSFVIIGAQFATAGGKAMLKGNGQVFGDSLGLTLQLNWQSSGYNVCLLTGRKK